MSASLDKSAVVSGQFFADKSGSRLIEKPTNGTSGWRDEGNGWEEWVYLNNQNYLGWYLLSEYKRLRDEQKRANFLRYQNNPALLRAKIDEKRRARRWEARLFVM